MKNKNINDLYFINESSDNDFYSLFSKLENTHVTDFHFEPKKENVKIRIRFSGIIKNYLEISHYDYEILINQLLIKCGMDVVKDFSNIDGSFLYNNKNYRVSFIKAYYGLTCVIRKLENIDNLEIKIDEYVYNEINELINNKTKLILFSGPTTSGKTTTMSYIVNKLKHNYKIHTIENPIEYKIPEVIQIQEDEDNKINALKYVLRQDPDIIVVGEIRESSFAKLLFQTSNTGHTVFGTVHSKNVFQTIERIKNLDIKLNDILSNTNLIINQRLIPINCSCCSGQGCELCFQTGKNGYETFYELLKIDDKIISIYNKYNYLEDIIKNVIKTNNYFFPVQKIMNLKEKKLISKNESLSIINSF